jgi:protein SCO1
MKPRLISILIGSVIGLVILLGYMAILDKPEQQSGSRSSGQALIGGPFHLDGHDGNSYSPADFEGRYMLLYFGYSFCPDVCPIDMTRMTMALDILDAEGVDLAGLQPLFITIDPARDTMEALGEFLGNFHPAFIGLRGSDAATAEAARSYRVYYAKGEVIDEDTYLMNHSNLFYLMGPDGRYITHFDETYSPARIADVLKGIL